MSVDTGSFIVTPKVIQDRSKATTVINKKCSFSSNACNFIWHILVTHNKNKKIQYTDTVTRAPPVTFFVIVAYKYVIVLRGIGRSEYYLEFICVRQFVINLLIQFYFRLSWLIGWENPGVKNEPKTMLASTNNCICKTNIKNLHF